MIRLFGAVALLLAGAATPAWSECEKSKAKCPQVVEGCKSICAGLNVDPNVDTAACKKGCEEEYPICEKIACGD